MARRKKRPTSMGAPSRAIGRAARRQHRRAPAWCDRRCAAARIARPVELILELVFVRKAIEVRAGRLVGDRHDEQHGALAVIVQSPAAAKDAFAVLPQDLRAAVRVRTGQRMRLHLSDSGVGPPNLVRLTELYVRQASPAAYRNRTASGLSNASRALIFLDPKYAAPPPR